jgi:replication factor A1
MNMEKEELAPYVSEIARVLGSKVSEQDILKELDVYVNQYRVSLETAKRSIVRKFGGDANALTKGGTAKKINEIGGAEQSVDLAVVVVSVSRKDIDQDGTTKTILYGLVGDETGTVPFTAWDADRFSMSRGDVLLIHNGYTKDWNGKPQLNLGNRATIEPQPADSIRLPEGVTVPQGSSGPETATIAQLHDGMNSVIVTARVLSVETRKIEGKDGPKTVYSGFMADDTGKVQFSAWYDFELKKDEVVMVQGAYVRSWRGIPQLNFGERANVTRVKAQIADSPELSRPKRRTVEEIERVGGALDVVISGVVVDVKKGSGLIFRCPQCNRLVLKGACRIHGKVDGQPDLRIKAVLDDGMGAITAVLNRDITEQLVGITLEESLKEAKEAMNPDVVKDHVEERLFGQPVEMRGNVTSDDFGLMMIVTEAHIIVPEVRNDAATLLAELEGAQ